MVAGTCEVPALGAFGNVSGGIGRALARTHDVSGADCRPRLLLVWSGRLLTAGLIAGVGLPILILAGLIAAAGWLGTACWVLMDR